MSVNECAHKCCSKQEHPGPMIVLKNRVLPLSSLLFIPCDGRFGCSGHGTVLPLTAIKLRHLQKADGKNELFTHTHTHKHTHTHTHKHTNTRTYTQSTGGRRYKSFIRPGFDECLSQEPAVFIYVEGAKQKSRNSCVCVLLYRDYWPLEVKAWAYTSIEVYGLGQVF